MNVFLGGVFVFVIAPVGFVVRRFKDPLARAWDPSAASYRVPSPSVEQNKLERMFL
jgi:hypothetical protein